MSSCVIRPIEPADAKSLADMSKELVEHLNTLRPGEEKPPLMSEQVFSEYAFGSRPQFRGLIAVFGEQPVGYALFNYGFSLEHAVPALNVIDLFVTLWARKNGVGTLMMSSLVNEARKGGCSVITSSVLNMNAEARSFYKYIGVEFIKDRTLLLWPKEKWPG